MKILVFGSGGLLGRELMRQAAEAGHEAHGTLRELGEAGALPGGQYHSMDLNDDEAVLSLLNRLMPHAIFYAAGYHPVDACETNPAGAMKLHAVLPAMLAAWCAKHDAWMGYVSTDYVFDGKKPAGSAYIESDAPAPQSIYARTKLSGEKVLLAQGAHASGAKVLLMQGGSLPAPGGKMPPAPGASAPGRKMPQVQGGKIAILRTSVVYGFHPTKKNFILWLLDELRANRQVKIVDDQFSTPTYADDLAAALLKLAEKNEGGLFHAAGPICLSRHAFALAAADAFGLDKKLIYPAKTSDLKQQAARPANGCLVSKRLEKASGVRFSTAEEGLRKLKGRMNDHS